MELYALFKVFLFGCSAGLALYFAPYFKSFLLYLKNTVENHNGKLEHKDLQLIIFSTLAIIIVITSANGVVYPDALIYSVFIAATGMHVGNDYFKNKVK